MKDRQTTLDGPRRIQRRRTKGWRAPARAVYVGRGSKWGNPCTQVRMPALDGSEWEREGRLGKTSGQQHAYVHPDKTITSHLVQDATREQAVAMYRRHLEEHPSLVAAAREQLAGRDLMCWCPPGEPCHADVLLELANQPALAEQLGHRSAAETSAAYTRPNTPDRVNDNGSRTIKLKRACNGCGQFIGDITDQEMTAAIEGQPLPDVRRECPACAPTAPPPACLPMQTVWGDALCLELECDHDLTSGEYCDEVTERVICGTHSETTNLGEIVRAALWPCSQSEGSER